MESLALKSLPLEKKILTSLEGKAQKPPPFWLMRQAGRYLPEYRALRQQAGSFLNLCFSPDLAAEVTLQPIERYDMDAAIIFSDILVIPHALGQKLDFVEGEGPRLGVLPQELHYDANKLQPVYQAIAETRHKLAGDKVLIGFAGSPWTVACYMVQGHGDGAFLKAKEFAAADPDGFQKIIDKVTQATIEHLSSQIEAGADVVQLFDSWAGLLQSEEFRRWVITPSRVIRAALKTKYPDTPVIGFPRKSGANIKTYAAETGIDALGLDPDISITEARKLCGKGLCLQGNLAPEILLEGGHRLEDETLKILRAAEGTPFIFNLGHGVIKETPPENVARLAQIIRGYSG